jgi:hypothetical protein
MLAAHIMHGSSDDTTVSAAGSTSRGPAAKYQSTS